MERGREEADLADWYGNSWAKSQKLFFVAAWLVLLWEALLRCCVTFSLVEWMSLCTIRFSRIWAVGIQVDFAAARCEGTVYGWYILCLAMNANPEMSFLKNNTFVNLWKLMKIDIFPYMHQDKNKKGGHLTVLKKWEIKMESRDKSKCQCGHVHILICLYWLPGEALTS